MAKKNRSKNNKKALNPSIYNIVNANYLPEDIWIQVKEIKMLISDIKKLDSRFNVLQIEKEYFSVGKISQFMSNGRNPEVGRKIIDKLNEIKIELERPEERKMNDQQVEELKKRVFNLIENKNYSKQEISRMLGKSNSYVSASLSMGNVNSLKNIEDFVKLLPPRKDEAVDLIPALTTLEEIPLPSKKEKIAVKIGNYYISSINSVEEIVITKKYERILSFNKKDASTISADVGGKVMKLSNPKVTISFEEEIEEVL